MTAARTDLRPPIAVMTARPATAVPEDGQHGCSNWEPKRDGRCVAFPSGRRAGRRAVTPAQAVTVVGVRPVGPGRARPSWPAGPRTRKRLRRLLDEATPPPAPMPAIGELVGDLAPPDWP